MDPNLERQIDAMRSALEQFRESVQRRLVKNALTKGMRVVTRSIKGKIPAEWKEIKPMIGQRIVKSTVGGEVTGKVGVAVGKRAMQKVGKKVRTGRPGVGVAPQNVHWFILGTKARTTKSGHRTGVMPPQVPNAVADGVASARTEARVKIVESLKQGIEKEAAKVRDKVNSR